MRNDLHLTKPHPRDPADTSDFTLPALADHLGISHEETLRYGPLPSLGAEHLRYRHADVVAWLDETARRFLTGIDSAEPEHEQLTLPGMEAV